MPHQCQYCKKIFTKSYTLKRHVKEVHERKRYHCPSCLLVFPRKQLLVNHSIKCTQQLALGRENQGEQSSSVAQAVDTSKHIEIDQTNFDRQCTVEDKEVSQNDIVVVGDFIDYLPNSDNEDESLSCYASKKDNDLDVDTIPDKVGHFISLILMLIEMIFCIIMVHLHFFSSNF